MSNLCNIEGNVKCDEGLRDNIKEKNRRPSLFADMVLVVWTLFTGQKTANGDRDVINSSLKRIFVEPNF
jgi:hypothetical protein